MNATPNLNEARRAITARQRLDLNLHREAVDLSEDRYRIVTDTGVAFAIVRTIDANGTTDHVCRSLESLRVKVLELREAGYLPESICTLRRWALENEEGEWYAHRIAQMLKGREDEIPGVWNVSEWVPCGRDAFVDPRCRYLAIDYTTGDPCDPSECILVESNRAALEEDEPGGFYQDASGAYCIDLDEPISAATLEALDRLESYPILDESDHSEREMAESDEAWEDWQRSDTEEAIGKAFGFDPDEGFAFDLSQESAADIEEECRRAAFDAGPGYNESGLRIAEVVLGKSFDPVAALVPLLRSGVVRLYPLDDEPDVLETVRAEAGGLSGLVNPEATVAILGRLLGDEEATEGEDIRTVAEAIARIALDADTTPPLPFQEEGAA